MKILISRIDSIGDVMLTLPLCGWIKKNLAGSQVFFLCQNLTKPIVERCSSIDQVIVWDGDLPEVDVIIHVFPNKAIAQAAKRKGISQRVGTSHRLFHFLTCNKRVNFSRKNSPLHESQLNFQLLKGMGIHESPSLETMSDLVSWRTQPLDTDFLKKDRFNLIFHMKSRGSAKEWPIAQYYDLAQQLGDSCNIILTGTKDERKLIANENANIFSLPNITDTTGKLSLSQLIDLIGHADGMLACSTGPLHIASISGIHTLGLYPAKKPMHAGRWMPIGNQVEVLSEAGENETPTLEIKTEKVIERILSWLS